MRPQNYLIVIINRTNDEEIFRFDYKATTPTQAFDQAVQRRLEEYYKDKTNKGLFEMTRDYEILHHKAPHSLSDDEFSLVSRYFFQTVNDKVGFRVFLKDEESEEGRPSLKKIFEV